jgi:PAS domain S-box-containing protein
MNNFSDMTREELIAYIKALPGGDVDVSPQPAKQPETGEPAAPSALRESEERMRAILDTAVEGIITIDERGLIELMNPAAERIFGYEAAEVIGKNVNILMPAPYHHEHDGYLANFRATGRAKIIGIGREVTGRRKDGTTFPMDLAVSEVRLPERRLFTGFVRDITERKRAELRQKVQYATVNALAQSNSLSEGAPKVMKSICEILGWSFGEFWAVDHQANVIHHVQSWFPTRGPDSEYDVLAAAPSLTLGSGLSGRVWATGKPEWMSGLGQDPAVLRAPAALREGIHGAVAFPILGGAEVLGAMVFFTKDPTEPDGEFLDLLGAVGNQIGQFIERTRAEAKLADVARALAEKNKELETIVYVASHDLRSPLVNIQGFSKELSRACETVRSRISDNPATGLNTAELDVLLGQDIPEAIEFILAGVKKIDTLLTGFLRFSRLGRAALKPERVNMNALLGSILQTMDFQIKQSGARFHVEALPHCVGDRIQLSQVFSNLLDNALKYLDPSRPGKVVVSGAAEGGRSIYAVRDNGMGIAPEHQGKIFEIFHRLNPSANEGEGLGLSIAQRILERHDGRIWVESVPNEGSTFHVSLPS